MEICPNIGALGQDLTFKQRALYILVFEVSIVWQRIQVDGLLPFPMNATEGVSLVAPWRAFRITDRADKHFISRVSNLLLSSFV